MAEKDDKVEELEPVGPGADMDDQEEIIRGTDGEEVTDRAADLEADQHADEREGHAEDDDETDPDRVKIRQRRREERRTKKERKERELNFLRQRNEQLERRQSEIDARMTQTEVVTIDGRIQTIEADIRKADDVYAEAISKGDGASAAEAQRIRDTLRDGLNDYKRARQGTINSARERLAPKQNEVDPEVRARAEDWVSRNDWYDPKLGDDDSAIAKAIEDRLSREKGAGASKTDAYWDELDRRLKKRLPHVFKNDRDDDDDDRDPDVRRGRDRDDDDRERNDRGRRNGNGRDEDKPAKRGGPRFTSGGRERPLKKGEVYVSEERRNAMEEAGVWDDPAIRNRYLKSYQNYDAAARRARR
jgi:hypothetical protein